MPPSRSWQGVHTVVVDEWHELIGNKRGVQVQLALARLARWNPQLVVWGLSATLGNLDEAMATLLGRAPRRGAAGAGAGPHRQGAGHRHPAAAQPGALLLGRPPGRADAAAGGGEIEHRGAGGGTTLVFTNTRSQAEIWYQLLLEARPDWAGSIALHHGSLDKAVREWVEAGLKAGTLKAVVATSSLDLGVDFLPVERVLQIGSAKGIARLLQRAGRSGHAARAAQPHHPGAHQHAGAGGGRRRAPRVRRPARWSRAMRPDAPLDVLVQHLVSVALGGGFTAGRALRRGARRPQLPRAVARRASSGRWISSKRRRQSLGAYPEYHRVVRGDDGVCTACPTGHRPAPPAAGGHHRRRRGHAGEVAQRRHPGPGRRELHRAAQQGRLLRLRRPGARIVRTQDMAAYVRKAHRQRGASCPLGRRQDAAVRPNWPTPRWRCCWRGPHGTGRRRRRDHRPRAAGRRAHARRTSAGCRSCRRPARCWSNTTARARAGTCSSTPLPAATCTWAWPACWPGGCRGNGPTPSASASTTTASSCSAPSRWTCRPRLLDQSVFDQRPRPAADVLASLNAGELAQRRFREIARVAGLVFTGYPGAPKSTRQLQASSSGLFYDVFRQYDPGNRLLHQADAEVLAQELNLRQPGRQPGPAARLAGGGGAAARAQPVQRWR
jgi:ATP-dependent Lhr-like helicase